MAIVLFGLTGLTMTPTFVFAASDACDGLKVEVTKARAQEYAPLVASAMEHKIMPAQVEFITIMERCLYLHAHKR